LLPTLCSSLEVIPFPNPIRSLLSSRRPALLPIRSKSITLLPNSRERASMKSLLRASLKSALPVLPLLPPLLVVLPRPPPLRKNLLKKSPRRKSTWVACSVMKRSTESDLFFVSLFKSVLQAD